jgi:predicted amidophosphoribosyltransferase
VAAGVYDGALRTAIRALKYRRVTGLGVPLGRLAAAQLAAPGRTALVVPVPPHRARTARRGIDHATLIAEAVAHAVAIESAPQGLVRVRATAPQYTLSPEGRRENVAGAFESGPEVAGRDVILVDDVHTTGATVDECSLALLGGGALSGDVCTVARAVLPPSVAARTAAAFGGPCGRL